MTASVIIFSCIPPRLNPDYPDKNTTTKNAKLRITKFSPRQQISHPVLGGLEMLKLRHAHAVINYG